MYEVHGPSDLVESCPSSMQTLLPARAGRRSRRVLESPCTRACPLPAAHTCSRQLGAITTCGHTWLQSPLCVPSPQLFLQHVALQHAAISHVWPKLPGFAACKNRTNSWPNRRGFEITCNWTFIKEHEIFSTGGNHHSGSDLQAT